MTEKEDQLKEIELEFKKKFPYIPIDQNKELFAELLEVLRGFVIPFKNDEIYVYMISREATKDVSKHIAELPQGVLHFEKWFKSSLLSFSTDTLNTVQSSTIANPPNASFAQLLDNKDMEAFFLNDNFSENEELELRAMLTPFINNPEYDLMLQSHSAMYLGANNTSKSLLKLWTNSLKIDGEDIQEIIEKAKKIEIENKKAAKDSQASNNNKHNKNRIIQSYAINKYLALPESSYSTIKKAAELIVDDVINYSLTSPDVLNAEGNFVFYSDKDGTDRPKENIRRWIGKYRNSSLKEK